MHPIFIGVSQEGASSITKANQDTLGDAQDTTDRRPLNPNIQNLNKELFKPTRRMSTNRSRGS